jgi:hypothetical protein
MEAKRIARVDENSPDIVGLIGELIPWILLSVHEVQVSASIGLDESPQQPLGMFLGDPSLPPLKDDRSQMLATRRVLRE